MERFAWILLAGCGPAAIAISDGGGNPPPRVAEVSIGAEDVSPTDPIEITFSEALDAASLVEDSVVLVEGDIDGAFRSDLDRPPLAESRAARRIPVSLTARGDVVDLVVARPMRPETAHTLAVSRAVRDVEGRQMDEPFALRFVTASSEGGAPVLEMLAPAAGATSVPTNLARVLLRFGEPVEGVSAETVALWRGEVAVGATVAPGDAWCAGCYVLEPGEALLPGVLHELRATDGIRDADGQAPFAVDPPSFTTGAGADTTAPVLWLPDVRVSGECLLARWLSDEPATSELLGTFDGRLVDVHEAGARLETPGAVTFHVESADAADNRSSLGPLEATYAPGPALVITEVLANPVGAEPAQEWVEVANLGAVDVALGGLLLADEGGDDELPAEVLAAGAIALVVGEAYDPLEGSDPPPGPGTVLLRVTGSLAHSGLRNSGERVEIRDAAGAVLSSYGGHIDTSSRAGQSAVRRNLDGCDLGEAWEASAPGASTPGSL